MMPRSARELIFRMMRAGSPWRALLRLALDKLQAAGSCSSNGAATSLRRPWNWQMPVSRLKKLVASSPNSGRQVSRPRSV